MTNKVPVFATVDPFDGMTGSTPGELQNLVGGKWLPESKFLPDIVDPINGEHFMNVPDTQDVAPFIAGLKSCPKTGLHNPFKNTERYPCPGRRMRKSRRHARRARGRGLLREADPARHAEELESVRGRGHRDEGLPRELRG